MKTIHVTVKLCINDNADAHETVQDCSYSFDHEDILGTEIVSVCDEGDMNVF